MRDLGRLADLLLTLPLREDDDGVPVVGVSAASGSLLLLLLTLSLRERDRDRDRALSRREDEELADFIDDVVLVAASVAGDVGAEIGVAGVTLTLRAATAGLTDRQGGLLQFVAAAEPEV